MEVSPKLASLLRFDRAWRRVWRDRLTDFVAPTLEYRAVYSKPSLILEPLATEVESGNYSPSPLRRIDVPKPDHTLRPGALPALKDRVFYQALTDYIAENADEKLLGPPTVFGFGLNRDADSEDTFLIAGGYDRFRARLAEEFEAGHQFVLMTDITAYFECVRDRYLTEILHGVGVDKSVIAALERLLAYWNRFLPTGLPQGVWPSDYLGARLYLDRTDRGMRMRGYRYFRYSDDIRVAGKSSTETRQALHDLVLELRAVGLHVQSAKTKLLEPEDTESYLERLHRRIERAGGDELADMLDIDPYGYTSPEDALRELTEEDILKSEPLLEALLEEAYGDGSKPDFDLCRTCIAGYRRVKSTGALPAALDLLAKLPALTEEIVRYLRVLAKTDSGKDHTSAIRETAVDVLFSPDTIYSWQKHWLMRLLIFPPIREVLDRDDAVRVSSLAFDRNEHWATRVMAISITGAAGDIGHVRRLKEMYDNESNADIRHAILRACKRLSRPERTTFYRLCEGKDTSTDLVITLLKSS